MAASSPQSHTGQSESQSHVHSGEQFPGYADLQEYNAIQIKMKRHRERLKQLMPCVRQVMETLPSRSFDVGNGKVKLTSVTTFRPTTMTLSCLKQSTLEMVLMQTDSKSRTHEVNVEMADRMATFLWSRRPPQEQTQRLQRTWSSKGKNKRRKSTFAGSLVEALVGGSTSGHIPATSNILASE
jgi:hypothetical protein